MGVTIKVNKLFVTKTLAVQIRQRFHCQKFPAVRSLKMYYGDGNVQYVQLTAHGQYRRFYGKLNKMICSASILCNLELATIIGHGQVRITMIFSSFSVGSHILSAALDFTSLNLVCN